MKIFFSLFICANLCACTYNVTMAHTEGAATDLIDETNENTPTVTATIKPSI